MVKIRLSRVGKKKVPFYRIVAVDSRKKRDGAYLENLGTYDGLKGILTHLNEEGIQDWIDKGAVLTDSVKKLIKLKKDADSPKPAAKKAKKAQEKPKTETKAKAEVKKEEPKAEPSEEAKA